MKKVVKSTKADKYWKQTKSTIKNAISGTSNLDDLEEIEIENPDMMIIYDQEDLEDRKYKRK